MKMKSRFMKQLYFSFVLPSLLISLLLLVVAVWQNGISTLSLLVLLLVAILIFITFKTADHIYRLRNNLINIQNGSLTDIQIKGKGIFAALNRNLLSIFQRIRKQEDELQREKLQRLRSVIDGQDQERNRLSRELHDGIGQSLIAVKLQLENAETRNYSMMRAGIDSAKNMIDITIEEVRRVCNALLLPHVERFNLRAAAARLGDIGRTLGAHNAGLAGLEPIEAIQKLAQQVGIPPNLRALGVKPEDFDTLARNAMKDVCGLTNPVQPTLDEVIGIFQAAY